MTSVRLLLPSTRIEIEAPSAALDLVTAVFFETVATEDGGFDHRFVLEPAGDMWRLARDGQVIDETARLESSIIWLEYQIELLVVSRVVGRLPLHAASVDVGSGACVIAGTPASGKSSTALQLLELGHRFVAEEVSVVEASDCLVEPFSESLSIAPSYIERFRQLFGLGHGTVRDLGQVQCRYLPRLTRCEPVPVRTILLPRYRAGATAEMTRVTAAEALPEMLGYCFETSTDDEEVFDRVIQLVETVPVMRLIYGDMASCRRLLAARFPHVTAGGSA